MRFHHCLMQVIHARITLALRSKLVGPYCNISATTGTLQRKATVTTYVSEIRGLGTTYLNAFGAFCLFVSFMYAARE